MVRTPFIVLDASNSAAVDSESLKGATTTTKRDIPDLALVKPRPLLILWFNAKEEIKKDDC